MELRSTYAKSELKDKYEEIKRDEQELASSLKRRKKAGFGKTLAVYAFITAVAVGGAMATGIIDADKVYNSVKSVFVSEDSSGTIENKLDGGN